jgi:hypothetical protein
MGLDDGEEQPNSTTNWIEQYLPACFDVRRERPPTSSVAMWLQVWIRQVAPGCAAIATAAQHQHLLVRVQAARPWMGR